METDQFFLKWFKRPFHAGHFGKTIAKWQTALEWNANFLENHDQPRSVSRFGDSVKHWSASAKMLCVLLLTLRGTPFIYQGQEIGMTDFDFTGMDQIRDIESIGIYALAKKLHIPAYWRWRLIQATSRDNARTPMQWSGEQNAGFTAGVPWIGVNHNFKEINVARQLSDPNSVRSFYKDMIALRSGSEVLKYGEFRLIRSSRHLLIYERTNGATTYRILLNFSGKTRKAPFCRGSVVLSNYGRTEYNGRLFPYGSHS